MGELFDIFSDTSSENYMDKDFRTSLERAGLARFQSKLAELGVEAASDITYLSNEILEEAGLRLVHRLKLRELSALSVCASNACNTNYSDTAAGATERVNVSSKVIAGLTSGPDCLGAVGRMQAAGYSSTTGVSTMVGEQSKRSEADVCALGMTVIPGADVQREQDMKHTPGAMKSAFRRRWGSGEVQLSSLDVSSTTSSASQSSSPVTFRAWRDRRGSKASSSNGQVNECTEHLYFGTRQAQKFQIEGDVHQLQRQMETNKERSASAVRKPSQFSQHSGKQSGEQVRCLPVTSAKAYQNLESQATPITNAEHQPAVAQEGSKYTPQQHHQNGTLINRVSEEQQQEQGQCRQRSCKAFEVLNAELTPELAGFREACQQLFECYHLESKTGIAEDRFIEYC